MACKKEVSSAIIKDGKFSVSDVDAREGSEFTILEQSGWWFGGTKKEISDTQTLQKDLKSYTTEYLLIHKQSAVELKKT